MFESRLKSYYNNHNDLAVASCIVLPIIFGFVSFVMLLTQLLVNDNERLYYTERNGQYYHVVYWYGCGQCLGDYYSINTSKNKIYTPIVKGYSKVKIKYIDKKAIITSTNGGISPIKSIAVNDKIYNNPEELPDIPVKRPMYWWVVFLPIMIALVFHLICFWSCEGFSMVFQFRFNDLKDYENTINNLFILGKPFSYKKSYQDLYHFYINIYNENSFKFEFNNKYGRSYTNNCNKIDFKLLHKLIPNKKCLLQFYKDIIKDYYWEMSKD